MYNYKFSLDKSNEFGVQIAFLWRPDVLGPKFLAFSLSAHLKLAPRCLKESLFPSPMLQVTQSMYKVMQSHILYALKIDFVFLLKTFFPFITPRRTTWEEEKGRFCSSYRHHFVSVLHEVMVHSTLLPKCPHDLWNAENVKNIWQVTSSWRHQLLKFFLDICRKSRYTSKSRYK